MNRYSYSKNRQGRWETKVMVRGVGSTVEVYVPSFQERPSTSKRNDWKAVCFAGGCKVTAFGHTRDVAVSVLEKKAVEADQQFREMLANRKR